jgi:hypothetical protein
LVLGGKGAAKDTYTYTDPGYTVTPFCAEGDYCAMPYTTGNYTQAYGPSANHIAEIAAGGILLVCSIIVGVTIVEVRHKRGYFW